MAPAQKNFVPPDLAKEAFHCPHCQTFAHVDWVNAFGGSAPASARQIPFRCGQCARCHRWTVWTAQSSDSNGTVTPSTMWYPRSLTDPPPPDDLSEGCVQDYEEARAVHSSSNRASAALLRLCIDKLCTHLGATGSDASKRIGDLVSKGLGPGVQKALDIVRVTGNHALHPGEMNLEDSEETVAGLFELVGMVVHEEITKPKQLARLYENLPEGDRQKIEKRDQFTKPAGPAK